MGRRENIRADIISNLPDDVIQYILSHLPLRDAVRTSILSTEWRYKWMSTPVLVFGHQFDKTFLRNHRLEIIIYQILLHNRGYINKFALQVPSYASTSDLNHWILLLSKYRVEDFILELSSGRKHVLPSHFFAFQQLKHLTLYRCVFRPPAEFKGFSRLVTLNFQDVDFVPEVVGPFISRCSVLERLRVVNCTYWDSIVVEGPSLRSFTFHGIFKSIHFKNCPFIDEIIMSTPVIVYGEIRQFSVSIKSFDFHPALKKLHLHPHMLEFLGAASLSSRRPLSLNNLKVLSFSMYLDTIKEVSCALWLLRSSPNLEMLRITFYMMWGISKDVVEFIRAQEDHHLNQLKRVEILCCCSSIKPQMEFARYLLASAAGLMEMAIISPHMDRMVNELQHVPKASPNARVVPRRR